MTPSTSLGPGPLRPLVVANYDVVVGGGEVGLEMLVDGLQHRSPKMANAHRIVVRSSGPPLDELRNRGLDAIPAGALWTYWDDDD